MQVVFEWFECGDCELHMISPIVFVCLSVQPAKMGSCLMAWVRSRREPKGKPERIALRFLVNFLPRAVMTVARCLTWS